jgi:hypothetical protein
VGQQAEGGFCKVLVVLQVKPENMGITSENRAPRPLKRCSVFRAPLACRRLHLLEIGLGLSVVASASSVRYGEMFNEALPLVCGKFDY